MVYYHRITWSFVLSNNFQRDHTVRNHCFEQGFWPDLNKGLTGPHFSTSTVRFVHQFFVGANVAKHSFASVKKYNFARYSRAKIISAITGHLVRLSVFRKSQANFLWSTPWVLVRHLLPRVGEWAQLFSCQKMFCWTWINRWKEATKILVRRKTSRI